MAQDKKIQVIKLTTGEDIIGVTIEETIADKGKILVIEKPCILLMRPKEDNPKELGLSLAPWAPYAKGFQVPIMPQHILSVFTPEDSLKEVYLNMAYKKQDASNVVLLNEKNNNV